MRVAGLEEIDTYISRRKNTVMHYISTHPIIDLCLYTEMRPVLQTPARWWENRSRYSQIGRRRGGGGGGVETYAGMDKRLGKGTEMGEKSGRGQGMVIGRRCWGIFILRSSIPSYCLGWRYGW